MFHCHNSVHEDNAMMGAFGMCLSEPLRSFEYHQRRHVCVLQM